MLPQVNDIWCRPNELIPYMVGDAVSLSYALCVLPSIKMHIF